MERQEKLAIFRRLFNGRFDVHSIGKADGKRGFFPARHDGELLPLDDSVLGDHFHGRKLVAQYTLREDGSSVGYWAIDFDNHNGTRDATQDTVVAYEHIGSETTWPIYVERSKSGTGYHVWGFFSEPVLAWKVRRVLLKLLVASGVVPKDATEKSTYDRIFPVQDVVKKGSFGNCLALPLNGKYVKKGNSCFIDIDGDLSAYPNQWEFLETIETILPEQLDEMADQLEVFPPTMDGHKKNDEKFPVLDLGQRPGLMRVLDNCDFIRHCKDNEQTLSEPLRYALALNLAPFEEGEEAFHDMQRKHPTYDPQRWEDKFLHAQESLKEIGPQTCAFIATIGFTCARNCLEQHGYKSPASWGRKGPVVLRTLIESIEQAEVPESTSSKIGFARDAIKQIDELQPLEQAAALQALVAKTGFRKGDLKDELQAISRDRYKEDLGEGGRIDPSTPLWQRLQAYVNSRRKNDPFDPWIYVGVARDWFQLNGGLFYSSQSGRYLFFQKHLYEIGQNAEFDALMLRVAHATREIPQYRCLWSGMQAVALESGTRFGELSWSDYEWANSRYFYNLNDPGMNIIEVSTSGVRSIPNGGNDQKKLLGVSEKIEPFVYNPAVDEAAAIQLLKTDFIDKLTCSEADAYVLLAWGLSMFLMEASVSRPLMKLTGQESSGKSCAAKMLSMILYGGNALKTATAAANYTDGARNPFLALDNVEARNISEDFLQFMLLVATGATREKRQRGTDKGLVQERLNCLVALTAIEGFEHSELISRTYEIDFSLSRKSAGGFVESEVLARLVHYRNDILSAVMNLISRDVLTSLGSVRRSQVIRSCGILHSKKDRTSEYFSLMMILLESLWQFIPSKNYADVWDMSVSWLKTQDKAAMVSTTETEPFVYFLNALHTMADTKDTSRESFESRFGLRHKFEDGGIFWIESTASGLLTAFDRVCRELGRRNPYLNTHRLDRRLRNGEAILNAAGWAREKLGMRNGVQWWKYERSANAPNDQRQEALFGGSSHQEPEEVDNSTFF